MHEYKTGTFKTYEALHVIHLNLNGGQVPRKLSAGELCQFDGSTIILSDDSKYTYTEFRGAIQRGWARCVDDYAVAVDSQASPRRTIRKADMTGGVSKHVPEIVDEDMKEVGKVDSNEGINAFLRDLKHRLGGIPEPKQEAAAGPGRYKVGDGPREVRSLSNLAPATPSADGTRPIKKLAMEVVQDQREVGAAPVRGAPSLEDTARAVVSNPDNVSTRGSAEVGTPQVTRMEDGSLRIAKKFKTPSNPVVGLDVTPSDHSAPSPAVAYEAPETSVADLIDQAKYDTVRFFVKGFKWDKNRSPNERVKEAVALKDKNVLKGVLAVEDDLVKSKIAETLSQKVRKSRQKGEEAIA